MRLAFGSDHAGYSLRIKLEDSCRKAGHETQSYGAMSEDAFDYPIAADQVCHALLNGHADLGIVICGSGIGVSIRANRYRGIRCALCTSVELAHLARLHNHANVLALGQRTTEPELANQILSEFLLSQPDGAERHLRRIQELDADVH